MSILNDDRRFGTDEERSEWLQEVNYEYRKEEYFVRECETEGSDEDE